MAYFERELLARWTRGEWINDRANTRIEGFSIDSRHVDAREMFIALRSPDRDGHDFVIDAENRGATAALTEQLVPQSKIPQLKVKQGITALQAIAKHHRDQFHGSVIGVTGSCGKTSTKDLLAHLMGESRVLKTRGNLNNHLGVPLTLLRLDPTQHDAAIIEAGINMKGEMETLADIINPTIGLVTMIGRAHLELLENLDSVAWEKSALLRCGKQKECVVYPASCLQFKAFRDIRDAVNHVLTPIGAEIPAFPWISPVHYWCIMDQNGGWRMHLRASDGIDRVFRIPGMSAGMRQNLALALFTAGSLGVTDSVLQARLNTWYPSDNRGQILRSGNSWIYSDCYNANPDSMRDSIDAFRIAFDPSLARLYVLGSMYELGPDAPQYHREIASRLKLRHGDQVIIIGKHADHYEAGLRQEGLEQHLAMKCSQAEEARECVKSFEGAVFLKGSRVNRLESLIPHSSHRVVLDSGKLC